MHSIVRYLSILCGSLAILMPEAVLFAAEPEGYYATAEGLEGEALRHALHDIIDGHHVIPYSSTDFDVHDAIDILDEDPADPMRVVLLYADAGATKSSWPAYNREHSWPQSLGADEGTPAYSDLHHIYSCDANVNSARGNLYYDACGSSSSSCSSHAEAPASSYDVDSWEPADEDKGDLARAMLYMDVRYEGDEGEPDLVVVESGVATGCDCMGRLSTLLTWHLEDPVDDRERERNEMVQSLQENRNPFIDHPEWVCAMWMLEGCTPAEEPAGAPWINELHYDNAGTDVDEGVEIAGPAGVSLEGWSLLFYNGYDYQAYMEVALSGVLDDEGQGYGALWFAIASIQNGAPDGLALVDPEGGVLELLSYEGTLTAGGGPAAGMTATDVGVKETGTTALGSSLQRTSGQAGEVSSWGAGTASPGTVNAGQVLPAG